MPKTHENTVEETLDIMLDAWVMARALREHRRATTLPQGNDGLTDRELLIFKLVESFPGRVTEKLITIMFDIYFAQVGQIVKRLEELNLVKKTGRGKPLELTANGKKRLREIQKVQASRFAFFISDLDPEEVDRLRPIFAKMLGTAKRLVEEQIFGMPPATERLLQKALRK